jgi:hypothetical protein
MVHTCITAYMNTSLYRSKVEHVKTLIYMTELIAY